MAQLNIVTQSDKTGDLRQSGDKPNGQRVGPMQPSVQRMTRSPEARKDAVRRAEQAATSRVTRFNPPAPEAPPAPQFPQASWLRILLIGLILVALVPNITLAVVLWLGLIDPPWAQQETPPPPPAVTQAPTPSAVLTAPAALEGAAGETISLPIALDGTDGVPARSIIAVKGLPAGSTLSDGRPYGDTEWNLKSDQIGDLHLVLPPTAQGEFQLRISLITPDDKIIADTEMALKVAPPPAPAESQIASPQTPADDARAEQAPAAAEPAEDDGSAAAEASAPQEGAASGSEDAASSASNSADTGGQPTNWVTPSVYVNLRDGPSSSSRVIGVIAKGTKLSVLERKRGWLQVSNPATSENGWIYSGYVEGGQKARPRAKRSASQDPPEQKQDSSFWKWLTQ